MTDRRRWMVEYGRSTFAALLLASSLVGQAEAVDARERAKFHAAIANDKLDDVKRLLEANPKLLDTRAWLHTALFHSALRGGSELFRYLLAKTTTSRFLRAAAAGKPKQVADMLKGHAGLLNERPRKEKLSALHIAAVLNDVETARILLEAGAEVSPSDYQHYRPYHLAARRGNDDIIRLLLARGEDVNRRNKWGWSALHQAVRAHRISTVKVLIEHGIDASIKEATNKQTALQMARNPDIVRLLEPRGADGKPLPGPVIPESTTTLATSDSHYTDIVVDNKRRGRLFMLDYYQKAIEELLPGGPGDEEEVF